jgi:broad specificity phosphatase PhoE
MTTLHVIRHGKAMAGADRYDQLHAIGEEQSRLLGRHLRDRATRFVAVYSGPLVRQLDTLDHMQRAAGEVGAAWPVPTILPELAEAPIEVLAKHCMAERLATDEKLQSLVARLAQAEESEKGDVFERLLGHVVRLWVDGEVSFAGLETASEFGRRVRAALQAIRASAPAGGHVAVITSNGVIGWLRGHAESDVEPERRCLGHRVFNASVSHFAIAGDKLELQKWNAVEHLTEHRLRTLL